MDAQACSYSEDYRALDCSLLAGNFTSVCQRFSGFEPEKTQFYHSSLKDNQMGCTTAGTHSYYSVYKMWVFEANNLILKGNFSAKRSFGG